MQITTIGLDIAKNVFQVHGIDTAEKVVVRRQLRRSQVLAFFSPPSAVLRCRRAKDTLGHLIRHTLTAGGMETEGGSRCRYT